MPETDPLTTGPRILTVVGNRPQFVKAAAVSGPLRQVATERLVHTGQHHDPELSQVFFDELAIPAPDAHLGVSGGSDESQVERMTGLLTAEIGAWAPDAVLVYGDTNSTLAGARAASGAGVPLAHVEAGMRSFDMTMPEERNRVATDQLSDLLLCSTQTAVANIGAEGLDGAVELVGDVMADVWELMAPGLRAREELLSEFGISRGQYLLATVHRAANVDTHEALEAVLDILEAVETPTVLALHPRTAARLGEFGLRERLDVIDGLIVTAPLGYLDFQTLLVACRALLTDSGGAQKEAYLAGVPCVTLRTTTEWTETVDTGWNVLTGLDTKSVLEALSRPMPSERPNLYGDAQAGSRVAECLRLLTS